MFGALTLLTAMMALHGAPVAAQGVCGSYASQTTQLNLQYGETRRSRGLSERSMFEVWANEETGTWTILEAHPNGMSCLRAAGENWQEFEPEIPGDDT